VSGSTIIMDEIYDEFTPEESEQYLVEIYYENIGRDKYYSKLLSKKNDDDHKIIEKKIGKIQDICNKKYYTRSNPLQLST
jgi:hypothetical protein